MLEDTKSPIPLALSMFGAVRIEKRPLRYVEESMRLISHTHQHRKPMSYFLNANPEEEEDEKEEAVLKSQPSTPVALAGIV